MRTRWVFEHREGGTPLNSGEWGRWGLWERDSPLLIFGTSGGWDSGIDEPTPEKARLIEAAPDLLEAVKTALRRAATPADKAYYKEIICLATEGTCD